MKKGNIFYNNGWSSKFIMGNGTGKISRQNMQPKGIHAGRFFCRPFIVGKTSMVIVLKARIWQTCYLSPIATSGVF
jgi:hypothetical protein